MSEIIGRAHTAMAIRQAVEADRADYIAESLANAERWLARVVPGFELTAEKRAELEANADQAFTDRLALQRMPRRSLIGSLRTRA